MISIFLKERILTFIINPLGDNNATSVLEIKVEKTKVDLLDEV